MLTTEKKYSAPGATLKGCKIIFFWLVLSIKKPGVKTSQTVGARHLYFLLGEYSHWFDGVYTESRNRYPLLGIILAEFTNS